MAGCATVCEPIRRDGVDLFAVKKNRDTARCAFHIEHMVAKRTQLPQTHGLLTGQAEMARR